MGHTGRWLLRLSATVAGGVVFAIVVLEIEIALGFRLGDSALFRYPWAALGLVVAALVFAGYRTWTNPKSAGGSAVIAAFGIVVVPFNALLEPGPPPITVDFWRGGGALWIERTMTVERSYPVVLVVTGPKDLSGKPPAPAPGGGSPGEEGADSVVAHLSGGPNAAFTINPDKEQAKPLAGAGDLRWTWDVRPRQEGPQRLILELDTTVKTPTGATTKGGIYRQFVLITVQAPLWYEAARRRVIAFFSGGP
jgi:hypothetical protein